jgi:DNA-binding CsgD family transcriptional regulator
MPPEVRDGLRSILHEASRALGAQEGGRHSPPSALGQEWIVVDRFEAACCEYVVARRVVLEGALALLTPRERQAAALVARGHSNKLIAFELRIAHSTVGVLLHRAAKKLGTTTRAQLAAAMRAQIVTREHAHAEE